MSYLYQFCNNFSFLILSAIGLSIIFGMMGIINLAHGEFIMLGAYITTFLATAGVPLPVAILIGALGTGVFGFLIDRLIISHLYNRPLDSVVATWGISLIMCQGMRILFGSSIPGTSTPLGSFSIGDGKYSVYRILLAVIALLVVVAVYFIFMHTKIGLHARATMQNSSIASVTSPPWMRRLQNTAGKLNRSIFMAPEAHSNGIVLVLAACTAKLP